MPRSPKFAARGGEAECKLPHFDDLLFLGASISSYPPARRLPGEVWGRRHKLAAALPVPVGAQLTLYRISTVNWDCRARYKV
jgi:hypothetical protein